MSARRPMQFPSRKPRSCTQTRTQCRHESQDRAHKPDTMSPRLLSHPCHAVEVCRGKEVSEAKVTMVPFFDNRADLIGKVFARERLVNIGILPSVNSTKQKRVVSLETSVCFLMTRLATSQKNEKVKTKVLWLL